MLFVVLSMDFVAILPVKNRRDFPDIRISIHAGTTLPAGNVGGSCSVCPLAVLRCLFKAIVRSGKPVKRYGIPFIVAMVC
jgi:hypothetical protein